MKIGIQTWGSHGDIRPFIALAEGLQRAGHEVTLVVTCVDSDAYNRLNLASGAKLTSIARKTAVIFAQKNPVKQIQLMIEDYFLPAEKDMFAASETLCQENELVIGHFFHYPLNTAALRYQKKYVSVALVHSIVPSKFMPPAGMPHLGTYGNMLSWKLARSIMNLSIKKYADRLRLLNGLPPAQDLVGNVWASEQLSLIAVSPQLCQRQSDWPINYQVCGFLTQPDIHLEGKVDDDLENFLASGDPPVFMTFGSIMSGEDLQETLDLFCNAATLAQVRAIIQSPNWRQYPLTPSQQVHFVGYTPHAMVFPRCCAIVHHGGAGTTQASLLSGKPSVIVPHTAEQEFWGSELQRLGVARKYLRRRSINSKKLANAINLTLQDKSLAIRAGDVSQSMADENGVLAAIKIIEQRFAS